MLKNITLSAEEKLIERARKKAESKNTTLNAEFRRWLAQYADAPQSTDDLIALMKQYNYVKSGRKYTRDEMNER
jgi:hypothetical protein